MIPELRYELLFFYTRTYLERLQPLSQALLNMIAAGSNVLPLRPVYRVDMGCYNAGDKIRIFVDPPRNLVVSNYEASVDHGDFAEIFRRLRNTCVMEFNVGIHDSPFLRYWKAEETATFAVVSIDFRLTDDTDYDLLDSIVNHLRPKTTSEIDLKDTNSKYLKLLARGSFLNNLHTCRLAVRNDAFPPPPFFFTEPGYRNYELDCWDANVASGIDDFIESFIRDGCANLKLQSVCLVWNGRSRALKQLCKPTKVDMPLPENDMTAWIAREFHQVKRCEMRSVVIAKQWKRMELYKWTVAYGKRARHRAVRVLLCRVENL